MNPSYECCECGARYLEMPESCFECGSRRLEVVGFEELLTLCEKVREEV